MLLLAVVRPLPLRSLVRLFPEKLLVMSNQVDSAHPYFVSLPEPIEWRHVREICMYDIWIL